MGKVNKFTGSKLLGAELRRLRGPRTLAEIAEISRSEPLRRRIDPVSAPSLCQIESGQTFPGLGLLHSLATIYRVSVQRLMNLVVEDRLTATAELPEDEAATDEAHRVALREGAWSDVVTLAIHGETLAPPERRLNWRARRASALHKAGMREEAISLLMECAELSRGDADLHLAICSNLADALMSAGLLGMARALMKELGDPVEHPPEVEGLILRRRARLNLEMARSAPTRSERLVREALLWIASARKADSIQPRERFVLAVMEALGQQLLGNAAVARRDLKRLLDDAEAAGDERGQVVAGLNLGQLELERGRPQAGQRILEHAASLAFRLEQHDEAFEAAFALYRSYAECEPAKSSHYLKRCGRLHPFVLSRSSSVRSYEELVQAGP